MLDESESDAVVLARSLTEPERFASIFDRHAALVFRFLVRRVGRDTADELLGETFRVAFERRHTYDLERENARPWLYGIATNLLSRHRRTEGRRLAATARLAGQRPFEPTRPVADHADALDAGALWPSVVAAITDLPDGERDALLLFVWEELTYEEIAAALDIPVGTVRSRLNRARSRLRELKDSSGEEPGNDQPDRSRIAT